MQLVDYFILIVTVLVIGILFSKPVRRNRFWQATVTPLASIIGSGFLIAAPILGEVVGSEAPLAMIVIVVFAYFLGGVIRFNIRYTETRLASTGAPRSLKSMELASNLAVFGAYLISVAFYIRLMAAFVLKGFEADTDLNANIVTTVILVIIGLVGLFRGLKSLEILEEYSVSIKLSIIAALFFGLAYAIFQNGYETQGLTGHPFNQHTIALLAGMLLVVQGFETSRYLGDEYETEMRISSMRLAQIVSGLIYVAFALLVLPLLGSLTTKADETAIIELSGLVSYVLPFLLIIAAAMSQFSAAIADTLGGGGLLKETSKSRIPARAGYAIIAVGAILLVWNANIFEIVAIASRAFAFYYLTQTLIALQSVTTVYSGKKAVALFLWFSLLAALLAWVVVFAVSVE